MFQDQARRERGIKKDEYQNENGEEILSGKRIYGTWTARECVGTDAEECRIAAEMVLGAVVGPPEHQKTVNAEVVFADVLGLVWVEGEEVTHGN